MHEQLVITKINRAKSFLLIILCCLFTFSRSLNTELLNCLRNGFWHYGCWHYQMQNCSIAHFSTEKWHKKIKKPIKDLETLLKILVFKATLVYMRWISCSNKIFKRPLPGSKQKEFLRKWLEIAECFSSSQLQEVKPAIFLSKRLIYVLETAGAFPVQNTFLPIVTL